MALLTRNKNGSTTESAEPLRLKKLSPDQFAELWQIAWNSLDPGQVLRLCTEDIVWDDPVTDAPAQGHAEVHKYLEEVWAAFPDMHFTYPEAAMSAENGRRLALHWSVKATMLGTMDPPGFAPTGKSFSSDGVDLLRLRDGRVEHYVGFFDRQSVTEQLGLMPATGSRGQRAAVRAQRALAKFSRK